jgi:hypothetical protein
MRLPGPGALDLTYCTNIHRGESLDEVRDAVTRFVVPVKARVSPDARFGVGLRLSSQATDELVADKRALAAFCELFEEHGLYVSTLNGFPYGQFHGTRVKQAVYRPDWRESARVDYTLGLGVVLAAMLPAGEAEGSISTVPGAFKDRSTAEGEIAEMVHHLVKAAAGLTRLEESTGKRIALALEPEPRCFLETIAETVSFFEERLFRAESIRQFADWSGVPQGRAEAELRWHLGVCFDACHLAVEFEDAADALGRLRSAGIRIVKHQISAGLEVSGGALREVIASLAPFDDGVYLHQVVEKRGETLTRFTDLPEAIAAAEQRGSFDAIWRIHFHVPLFHPELGPFGSTRSFAADILRDVAKHRDTRHLEVETYTWDVLPEAFRSLDVVDAIAREIAWAREQLGG